MINRRQMSIRKRLIVIFIPLVIVPLILANIFTYLMLDDYIRSLILEKLEYSNMRILEDFKTLNNNFEEYTKQIITNSSVQKSLESNQMSYPLKTEIEQYIKLYINDNILNIIYLDNNNGLVTTSNVFNETRKKIEDSKAYSYISNNYAEMKLVYNKERLAVSKRDSLIVLRNVRHLEYSVKPGKLLMFLDISTIDNLFRSQIDDSKSEYILVDDNGQMIFNSLKDGFVGETFMDHYPNYNAKNDTLNIDNKEYIISKYEDEITNWHIISAVATSDAFATYNKYQKGFYAFLIFISLLAFFIVVYFSYNITKPIIKLYKAMEGFDNGRFVSRLKLEGAKELQIASNSFNHMANEIEELLIEIKKERQKYKNLEIKSLVYQINPHFIYNTLDNIYMLARIEKNKNISNLIYSLSKFLRITLSKGSDFITIDKEVLHAKYYLQIQKLRYENLFDFQINLEKEVKDKKVIKFLLQPIIENSIEHGFDKINNGGVIKINAFVNENNINIIIEDNGRGFPKDILEFYNDLNNKKINEIHVLDEHKEGGYGLVNIISRLKLAYGKRYSLIFTNTSFGSKCTISIRDN